MNAQLAVYLGTPNSGMNAHLASRGRTKVSPIILAAAAAQMVSITISMTQTSLVLCDAVQTNRT